MKRNDGAVADMQHILKVLTPADSVALLSLEEAKLVLNIPGSDTTKDATLTMLIEQTSDVLATLANRVFVYEEVQETFYAINNNEQRLYFSRWPVKLENIQMLSVDDVDILQPLNTRLAGTKARVSNDDWVLEESTGTLFMKPTGVWSGTVDSIYSAGYVSPDEVPPALKQCAIMVLREAYYQFLRGAMLSGVRMIAHKHARVMYYPQGGVVATGSSGGLAASPAVARSIDNVLMHYVRHWV
jgi:hypothetical protein